jgi:hypothetical protein
MSTFQFTTFLLVMFLHGRLCRIVWQYMSIPSHDFYHKHKMANSVLNSTILLIFVALIFVVTLKITP